MSRRDETCRRLRRVGQKFTSIGCRAGLSRRAGDRRAEAAKALDERPCYERCNDDRDNNEREPVEIRPAKLSLWWWRCTIVERKRRHVTVRASAVPIVRAVIRRDLLLHNEPCLPPSRVAERAPLNPHLLTPDRFAAYVRDTLSGPFHCFKVQVADARGEEDHPLNAALAEQAKTGLALAAHQVDRHWAVGAVVPHVQAEEFAGPRGESFGALEVALEVVQRLGLPRPERDFVADREVVGDGEIELVVVEDDPEVQRLAAA